MIGFQRSIGNILYWDVSAGVGPLYYNDILLLVYLGILNLVLLFDAFPSAIN